MFNPPQVSGILQSSVPRSTVGHEPGDLLSLVGRIVEGLGLGSDSGVVVLPSLVWRHHSRVGSVGRCPVEN